jgi:hypothetical protein
MQVDINETPWPLETERHVTRLLIYYCHLVDSGAVDRIAAEVFAADAIADFQGHIWMGRTEIGDYLMANVPRYKVTAHTLSNVWFSSCDSDRAVVRSNLTAWHWWNDEDIEKSGLTNFVQVVQNTDEVQRTSEGWRITKRRTEGIGSPSSLSLATLPNGLLLEFSDTDN